jgi:ammonium transporter Rh
MEVVLNATLAGGVAVGSACDLLVSPAGGLAIGAFAGIVSAFGFLKLGPYLQEKIGLHDTCGVHNLHGLPGIMGGIIGSIVTAASEDTF